MAERPNYYLLLELDPSIDDWAIIEARITDKRRQWSTEKTMGSPASRRKAGLNLSIVSDIRDTLKDPKARAQEAKEARKLQEQERQAKIKELDEFIRILSARGQCTRDQIKQLSKQGFGIPENEIELRVRRAGVPIIEDRKRIDPSVASIIRANLSLSKHPDLYDFLGLNRHSSPNSLCERAHEINKEILKRGMTDPLSSARKELAGICLAVFREDTEKEKYDNERAFEGMDLLRGRIELAASHDGSISIREMEELLNQAIERGVNVDDARFYIRDYAKRRKWMVEFDREVVPPSGSPLPRVHPIANTEATLKAAAVDDRSHNPRVFLCHSHGDKVAVRHLYYQLRHYGIMSWLDEHELLPGQEFDFEIRRALRNSDVIIVFLSKTAVTRKGYLQRELRIVLDLAEEHPEGSIFIIPLKLDDCDVPERLRRYQSVSILEGNYFEKLLCSLDHRSGNVGALRGK